MQKKTNVQPAPDLTRARTAFAVIERELIDEEEHFISQLFVTDVPDNIDRQQIKEAIDKTGRVYGVEGRRWVNHTILPFDRWPDVVRNEYDTKGTELGVQFDDLDAEARGEKRVTLRMEKALHSLLTRQAYEMELSFNDFCLVALEWVVSEVDLSGLRKQTKTSSIARRMETSSIPQRDAMRALYRLHQGNKDACIKGWIQLYKANLVAVGRNPERYPPDTYAPQLWSDGQNKQWLTDKVSDTVMEIIREFASKSGESN